MIFENREEAGQMLGSKLHEYAGRTDVLVLALPRGGVPVGYEVAHTLGAPLDIFIVRKLGVPGHEELAMGAIASGGITVINDDVVRAAGITRKMFDLVAAREQQELARRETLYRGAKLPLDPQGKICILVDDGIATGASMQAAVMAVRKKQPAQIIVATPVASPVVYQQFEGLADRVVCVETPANFGAVGAWYHAFPQNTDEEVRFILNKAEFGNFPWRPDADVPPAFK